MGDAGALFLGLLIAILTVRFKPSTDSSISSFAVPVLLLAIPILDTTVAVFSRIRRKVSPFQGGKDHLSHRLIRYGLSRKVSAITLWLLSALYGLFAVLISMQNINSEYLIILVAFIIWISLLFVFLNSKDE